MQVGPIKPNGEPGVTLPAQAKVPPISQSVIAVPVGRPAVSATLGNNGLATSVTMTGPRHWTRREILYGGNEAADVRYKITKGIVAEFKDFPDGRRQIVAIRTAGDICGYPTRKERYVFTGQAITPVEACAFGAEKFRAFMERNTEFACAVADDVAERLNQALIRLTVVGQCNSLERVAYFILDMEKRQRSSSIYHDPVALHLTRGEIADYLGLTLETVSRAFSTLKRMRLIALEAPTWWPSSTRSGCAKSRRDACKAVSRRRRAVAGRVPVAGRGSRATGWLVLPACRSCYRSRCPRLQGIRCPKPPRGLERLLHRVAVACQALGGEGAMIVRLIDRYLDPSETLLEVLFGLIMALTITAGARMLSERADIVGVELALALLGCNVAWGVIDGAFYLLGTLFSRNRRVQFVKRLQAASTEEDAMAAVKDEFDLRGEPSMLPHDETRLHRSLLELFRHSGTGRASLQVNDWVAAALIVVLVSATAIPEA